MTANNAIQSLRAEESLGSVRFSVYHLASMAFASLSAFSKMPRISGIVNLFSRYKGFFLFSTPLAFWASAVSFA